MNEDLIVNNGDNQTESEDPHEHPIAKAIDTYIKRLRGIQLSAIAFIPKAYSWRNKALDKLKGEFEEAKAMIEEENPSVKARGIKKVSDIYLQLGLIMDSEMPEFLERGLFICVFSTYDSFISNILKAVYSKKPELFNALNGEMGIKEMMKYESLSDIKDIVLAKELEVFLHKSYGEQFKDLENRFSIRTLRGFDNWPKFVECSQRRNLVAHCDGVVNKQYLTACKNADYGLPENIKAGDKIGIGPDYFFASCELLSEVGTQLAHTIWRKLFPNELETADRHLTDIIYDYLRISAWERAKKLGKFAVEQPRVYNEERERINLVNYVIALKFGGDATGAERLLKDYDWSATKLEFELAEAVLSDDFTKASEIMRKIGKVGTLLTEDSYYIWPLFRDFRESEVFLSTYAEIYGYEFTVKLGKDLEKIKKDAESAMGADDLEFFDLEVLSDILFLKDLFFILE